MPGGVTFRPYAARAIITHAFDIDHLDIWIVFRHPMNQDIKPADNLWLVEVEEILEATTASEWQDEFTMLLTVAGIGAIPDKVTVAYAGPSTNLRTTWRKQWEPWGPILSSDGTLLAFGSFKGNEINWQQAAAQNVFYTISDADITAGPLNKTTFQNNQELKISVSGFYQVHYYITVEISIAGKHVKTAFEINGTEQDLGQVHHHFGRANEEESWAGAGIFNLTIDDVLSIGIETTDAGNPTVTTDHVGLVITEIGQT